MEIIHYISYTKNINKIYYSVSTTTYVGEGYTLVFIVASEKEHKQDAKQ